MDKNNIASKKVMKSRAERLKKALQANMGKRKAQAEARLLNLHENKNIKFKQED
tara:strand:+ start:125 stop:286 length:162 start_codon:yes stop_codon:yes gene_type:complete